MLLAGFRLRRINHQEAYGLCDDAQIDANNAQGFFSVTRRGEISNLDHVADPRLLRFAQTVMWGEDHKPSANGEQGGRIVALAIRDKPFPNSTRHWRRHLAS